MRLPLQGVTILDLSTVISGPMAVCMLADQGASVIKLEALEGDTCRMIGPAKGDLSAMYIAVNRGKRSLALDLKAPASKPIFEALVKRADVIVSNFRPGVMDRLGLSDHSLVAMNPRLIRLSISGYGDAGPYAGDKVYDSVIQAVSGFCAAHREFGSGSPSLLSTTLCDKLTAINAAQAVSIALYARERDGKGCRIDLAMLDAALAFQWPDAMYNHAFIDEPPKAFPEFGATFRPWKTKDGYVTTMAPQQSEFEGLCKTLENEDIPRDPRFATLPLRSRHAKELRALFEPLMLNFTCEQIVERGRKYGVPTARVNERAEVVTDPQVVFNESLVNLDQGDVGQVRVARSASKFDGQALPLRGPAAHLGEHTREVLLELGFSEGEITGLLVQGTVAIAKAPTA